MFLTADKRRWVKGWCQRSVDNEMFLQLSELSGYFAGFNQGVGKLSVLGLNVGMDGLIFNFVKEDFYKI
ncbi:MAG TPA: hypothetical protein VIQ31_28255 [Phormidium sp.]